MLYTVSSTKHTTNQKNHFPRAPSKNYSKVSNNPCQIHAQFTSCNKNKKILEQKMSKEL
jgi:hypothetical protein